jgi:hypothetical protein
MADIIGYPGGNGNFGKARAGMAMRTRRNRRQGPDDLITASEIGSFAFCPEAWRLEDGLGVEPENQAALKAGDRHHARKAVAEQIAGGSITLGRIVAVAALLVLLLWLWWRL